MKPPKFHVGQAVVCIKADWFPSDAGCPAKGEVGHVRRTEWSNRGFHVIWLAEKDHDLWFNEAHFAPAEYLSDEALSQLLEETLDPVTA